MSDGDQNRIHSSNDRGERTGPYSHDRLHTHVFNPLEVIV
jgi:hypothetical protein